MDPLSAGFARAHRENDRGRACNGVAAGVDRFLACLSGLFLGDDAFLFVDIKADRC